MCNFHRIKTKCGSGEEEEEEEEDNILTFRTEKQERIVGQLEGYLTLESEVSIDHKSCSISIMFTWESKKCLSKIGPNFPRYHKRLVFFE